MEFQYIYLTGSDQIRVSGLALSPPQTPAIGFYLEHARSLLDLLKYKRIVDHSPPIALQYCKVSFL